MVEERIHDPEIDFATLMAAWPWRPIAGCPGRFRLPGPQPTLEELVGPAARPGRHRVPAARDEVWVLAIRGGGLITYRRADGSLLHTLNTPEGFGRKLDQLGIG